MNFNKNFLDRFCSDINLESIHKTKEELSNLLSSKITNDHLEGMVNKTNINTVILVKDQESYIINSISSALEVSDHTYVFDTGSKDKTIENINQTFKGKPVTISHLDWKEDYAYMRNMAASHVPDGWILIIDSDEEINPSINKIYFKMVLSFLDFLFPKNDLSLAFKQISTDVNAFAWPERVYKKRNSISFFGYVHEELRSPTLIPVQTFFTVKNQGTKFSELTKFNKQHRYFKLSLRNYDKEPNNPKWLALMPVEEALKYDKEWYLNILNTNLERILKNKKESFYDKYILVTYINIQIIILKDTSAANKIIEFARKKYPDDSRFIAYKFLSKDAQLENEANNCINELRNDVSKIKENYANHSKWQTDSIEGTMESLTGTMASLLIKAGYYDIALNIIKSGSSKEDDQNLIDNISELKKYEK